MGLNFVGPEIWIFVASTRVNSRCLLKPSGCGLLGQNRISNFRFLDSDIIKVQVVYSWGFVGFGLIIYPKYN